MIQAKQGKIETKNGKTYLVLQHADVNHVIMFSDRPNRIVKTITGNDLQKLWKVGNNSFEKDPPNAVLSSAGQSADCDTQWHHCYRHHSSVPNVYFGG